MAAVLACGEGAVLSHGSAAEVWGVRPPGRLEVTVPPARTPRRPGIVIHRTVLAVRHRTVRLGIPVTTPSRTLVDSAPRLSPRHLGVANLRTLLDPLTFTLTDSTLERLFKPLARAAGLPGPLTRQYVNGLRVDFYWPRIDLVVETDGLSYHRTPAQQARDRFRDQAHARAGTTELRFTYAQVRWEPDDVVPRCGAWLSGWRQSVATLLERERLASSRRHSAGT